MENIEIVILLRFSLELGASKRNYSKCVELPPLGVFYLNLSTEKFHLYPWQSLNEAHLVQLNELQEILETDIEITSSIDSPWLIMNLCENKSNCYNFESILKDYIKNSSVKIFERLLDDSNVVSVCDEIIMRLKNSISDRLATPSVCRECLQSNHDACDHARIGILFSGGIDCTILAVLADKLFDASQPIDLINVSFEKINRSNSNGPIDYNTPDRISARQSVEELKRKNPKR